MRAALPILFCLPILAQLPEGLAPDFLKQSPKTLRTAAADKARVIRMGDAEVLARCGALYLAAGQRDRAEDAFRRVLEADPTAHEYYALVASAWMKAGFKNQAREVLKHLPADTPKAADGLWRVATMFLEAQLDAEAIPYAQRAWAANPKRWEGPLKYGCELLKRGRQEEARPWFERVLALRPRDEQVWLAIAEACPQEAK